MVNTNPNYNLEIGNRRIFERLAGISHPYGTTKALGEIVTDYDGVEFQFGDDLKALAAFEAAYRRREAVLYLSSVPIEIGLPLDKPSFLDYTTWYFEQTGELLSGEPEMELLASDTQVQTRWYSTLLVSVEFCFTLLGLALSGIERVRNAAKRTGHPILSHRLGVMVHALIGTTALLLWIMQDAQILR